MKVARISKAIGAVVGGVVTSYLLRYQIDLVGMGVKVEVVELATIATEGIIAAGIFLAAYFSPKNKE